MAKCIFECDQGHDPEIMEVEAETEEEAMTLMKEKAKAHLAQVHSDMAGLDDNEVEQMIRKNWHKDEDGMASGTPM